MADLRAGAQPDPLTVLETQQAAREKPIVVGLYGMPGSGKTFLLNQLKQELGQEHFAFFEGSQMIDSLVSGGLDAFKEMEEQGKVHWRKLAIDRIGKECADSGRVAIVVGHFMFWSEGEEHGRPIHTQNDMDTFTHILYLDVPAEDVAQRRLNDTGRDRPSTSVGHLREWLRVEKTQLRRHSYDHGILFSLLTPGPMLLSKVSKLLSDFRCHTEKLNLTQARHVLDEALSAGQDKMETMLVMDGDKTLAAEDTGAMFWERLAILRGIRDEECPLTRVFRSPMGYSYTAFRQAALLHEETTNDQEFETLCQAVASAVTMHSTFVSLLQRVTEQNHVGAVIVTCGLRRIWEKVLERESLSKTVKVIGAGRIGENFIVTGAIKAALVAHLQGTHKMNVWAFGDSRLDLDMLGKADKAIVVVGEEQSRSKSMDQALIKAIDSDGLRASQVVLPSDAPPRLDTTKLPLIQLTDPEFVESVLCHRIRHPNLQLLHATDKIAAKLLMTPMRDARYSGPALREAHRRVGWYLATEFLAVVVGLEEYSIKHVLGHEIRGYQLFHEQQTSIVALMRGGEPMAQGVSDAFPRAMFIHAGGPDDIKLHHLKGQLTLVLVDSVVNSGKSVIEFVQHIRKIHATIRIVVVTGVAQAESVSSDGNLAVALAGPAKLTVIALRISDTKFTGSGTTDTGNRLFNTTHLP